MTDGGSSIPEVQQLLRVLAAGRRVGETGTAFGEGAAAMAETATSVVTVELDPDRAAGAARRLAPYANVELLVGDWREHLPPRAPFDLLFFDGGGWKPQPYEEGPLVLSLVAPNGLLVVDDLTPGRQHDVFREYVFGHPQLIASELLITPEMAVIVATVRP
jgi:predicted O-methyltransferase YrrM